MASNRPSRHGNRDMLPSVPVEGPVRAAGARTYVPFPSTSTRLRRGDMMRSLASSDRRDPTDLPSLREVISVNERVITPDGRERLVTAVELWTDHAVVQWSDSDFQLERDPLRPRTTLQDSGRGDPVVRPVVTWKTTLALHTASRAEAAVLARSRLTASSGSCRASRCTRLNCASIGAMAAGQSCHCRIARRCLMESERHALRTRP
jgi:hypothetical protein